jgi:hypothetical protein
MDEGKGVSMPKISNLSSGVYDNVVSRYSSDAILNKGKMMGKSFVRKEICETFSRATCILHPWA